MVITTVGWGAIRTGATTSITGGNGTTAVVAPGRGIAGRVSDVAGAAGRASWGILGGCGSPPTTCTQPGWSAGASRPPAIAATTRSWAARRRIPSWFIRAVTTWARGRADAQFPL